LIASLLTFAGHHVIGQMIFIDGDTDALMRPEAFQAHALKARFTGR
jgi:hypothetical protein